MREIVADVFVLTGVGVLVYAAWTVAPWLGLAGIGCGLIGLGLLMTRGKK